MITQLTGSSRRVVLRPAVVDVSLDGTYDLILDPTMDETVDVLTSGTTAPTPLSSGLLEYDGTLIGVYRTAADADIFRVRAMSYTWTSSQAAGATWTKETSTTSPSLSDAAHVVRGSFAYLIGGQSGTPELCSLTQLQFTQQACLDQDCAWDADAESCGVKYSLSISKARLSGSLTAWTTLTATLTDPIVGGSATLLGTDIIIMAVDGSVYKIDEDDVFSEVPQPHAGETIASAGFNLLTLQDTKTVLLLSGNQLARSYVGYEGFEMYDSVYAIDNAASDTTTLFSDIVIGAHVEAGRYSLCHCDAGPQDHSTFGSAWDAHSFVHHDFSTCGTDIMSQAAAAPWNQHGCYDKCIVQGCASNACRCEGYRQSEDTSVNTAGLCLSAPDCRQACIDTPTCVGFEISRADGDNNGRCILKQNCNDNFVDSDTGDYYEKKSGTYCRRSSRFDSAATDFITDANGDSTVGDMYISTRVTNNIHYIVPNDASNTTKLIISGTGLNPVRDRIMIVESDGICGESAGQAVQCATDTSAMHIPLISDDDGLSVMDDSALVEDSLEYSIGMPSVGQYKICFCDHTLQAGGVGQGFCGEAVTDFKIEIGTLHVSGSTCELSKGHRYSSALCTSMGEHGLKCESNPRES